MAMIISRSSRIGPLGSPWPSWTAPTSTNSSCLTGPVAATPVWRTSSAWDESCVSVVRSGRSDSVVGVGRGSVVPPCSSSAVIPATRDVSVSDVTLGHCGDRTENSKQRLPQGTTYISVSYMEVMSTCYLSTFHEQMHCNTKYYE